MKKIEMPGIKAMFVGGLVIAIVCLASAKIHADKRVRPSAAPAMETAVTAHVPATVAPLTDTQDDKGLWLTIRPTGFETKEMTIDAGDYFVVIQNATGLDRFALRIQREGGQTIHDVRLPRFHKYWKHEVHLTSGRYLVSEVDHPDWSCVVIVN
ncbi:MAG TPA: hypothetical protein VGO56_13870 [Pyrinomonadaceae bacterium]|jgi:hypothetical protein|nr:hypothetical protein [Pyrinomonadaceae bacterium]